MPFDMSTNDFAGPARPANQLIDTLIYNTARTLFTEDLQQAKNAKLMLVGRKAAEYPFLAIEVAAFTVEEYPEIVTVAVFAVDKALNDEELILELKTLLLPIAAEFTLAEKTTRFLFEQLDETQEA